MNTLLVLYLTCACAGTALALWRPPLLPRASWLLVIAAAPQLSVLLGIHVPGTLILLVTMLAIALWCWANRWLAGVAWIAVGAGLNALVMALHGGAMPIHAETLAAFGADFAPGVLLEGSKDVVVQSSALGLLADWLPLPLGPGRAIILSPGDLLIVAGILYWLLASPSQRKELSHASAPSDQASGTRHSPPAAGKPAPGA